MPKTRIYRREFNKEGPNPRQLVATFTPNMKEEAAACFSILFNSSTSWDEGHFQQYRYTMETDPEPIESPSEKEGIQVDVSKAKATKRPISYQFSWEIIHGDCHCLAWHRQYGTIRGIVEDSPKGRNLFRHRIMAVWPNAEIASK